MADNSPIDPIAELRRLQLELAEIDDESTKSPQLPDSRGSLNTELLRELQTLRKENAEFKKAQGEINRSIFEEFRKVNQSLLEKLEEIQNEMADLKISQDSAGKNQTSIVEEIIGTWRNVEKSSGLKAYKQRKFFWRDNVIIERVSFRNSVFHEFKINVSQCLVDNQFRHDGRLLYMKNNKLRIGYESGSTATYKKLLV